MKTIRGIPTNLLIDAYYKHGSIYGAAAEFGVRYQSIHKRLQKAGIDMTGNGKKWTTQDDMDLICFYADDPVRGDGRLDALAKKMGRTKHYIVRQARRLELTNKSRTTTPKLQRLIAKKSKQHIELNGHPRGALGMNHSSQTKATLSEALKKYWEYRKGLKEFNHDSHLFFWKMHKQRKNCHKYYYMKRLATPVWADHKAIDLFYQTALPGEQVDHIIPIRGKTVSGLHCEANLQHLRTTENRTKGNKYWPDMWE